MGMAAWTAAGRGGIVNGRTYCGCGWVLLLTTNAEEAQLALLIKMCNEELLQGTRQEAQQNSGDVQQQRNH